MNSPEPKKSPLRLASEISTGLPITELLITVLPILVAVGVIGYWSWQKGRNAVTDLADEFGRQINARIETHVENYLTTSELFLKINAISVRQEQLTLNDFQPLQHYFWEQTKLNKTVTTLYYGSETGDFLQIEQGDPPTVTIRTQNTAPLWEIYRLNARGERQERLQTKEYDPRSRPWYRGAKAAKTLIWSPIYVFAQPPILGISPAIPVYGTTGELQGVMAIDLTLSRLGEFLQGLEIGRSGEAFIIERSGEIVASSIGSSPLKEIPEGWERLSASASGEPMIQAAVNYWQKDKKLAILESDRGTIVDAEGNRYFVQIKAFENDRGIDWLLGVIIPEADFKAQIAANTRATLLISFIAFILATILAIASKAIAPRLLKN